MKSKNLFLAIALCISTMTLTAQDMFNSNNVYFQETNSNQECFSELDYSNMSMPPRHKGRRGGKSDNKFAVGMRVPYNFTRFGLGVNASYNFTKVLRFSLGFDYYLTAKESKHFKTIDPSGNKGEDFWGWKWNFSPNLNFVFGDGDFHFYIIGGLYLSGGYHQIASLLTSDWTPEYDENGYVDYGDYVVIKGEDYFKTDKIVNGIGIGVNIGCGIEYQVSEKFRISLDQELSLGLRTNWMMHLGAAYCF